MNILRNSILILTLLFSNFIFANENDYNHNIEERINSIVDRYGYKFYLLENDQQNNWDSIKVRLKLMEPSRSRTIPNIKHIIIDKNNQYYFMVFDTYQGNKKQSAFKNVKQALSKFKRSDYSRLMIFSMPVQGDYKKTIADTKHYLTTNYSILLDNSSQAHLGFFFERNGEVLNNVTKKIVIAKKDREESIVKDIVSNYSNIIIPSEKIDMKKIIVLLFSESCGYCKKMLRESELYNNKGFTLIPLPATTLYFDQKYNQSTYKFFCGNPQQNFENLKPSNDCDMDFVEEVFNLKKHLLGGVEYRGTPTLYLTEYGLWYSGYLSPDKL